MCEVVGYGQTVEEATANALKELKAPADAEVFTELIEEPRKKILGVFGGSPAKVKAYYDKFEYEMQKEKLRKEAKEKKLIDEVNSAMALIKIGEYNKAENTIYTILYNYDDQRREIERLEYLRSAAWFDNDENKQNEYTKRIAEIDSGIKPLKLYIDDLRFAYALAAFKKRSAVSVESIVKILAAIYHSDIKDGDLRNIAKEITDEYGEEYLSKAKECYVLALDYMDDGDMAKAKKYMALPGMLNHRDAEQLYAILRVVVDNDPDSYEEIIKILVNGVEKIESAHLKQVAKDTIKELGKSLKAMREMSPGKSLPKNKNSTVLAAKATNALADEEIVFMNWVIEKNKSEKDYENDVKKGKQTSNPVGDSDFPADVEVFPSSDKIW